MLHVICETALLDSDFGNNAATDFGLAIDCVRHARLFFTSPDLNLSTAAAGSFTLMSNREMTAYLARDYAAMTGMIFGEAPPFTRIIDSLDDFEAAVNKRGAHQ